MRGFIGPENAHFRSFFPAQKRVLNNLKNFKTEQLSHQAHSHHSALGGLMVMFLLIAVAFHVSAVLIIQYRYKVPLIKRMISGTK
ncbi:MAG: hypothetical protein VB958_11210 [Thalassolituus sp.]|uniref:hypothetical protein n=1 Tax=Thalassolituus sp. TaxID=2030822 RepID=UPI0039821A07